MVKEITLEKIEKLDKLEQELEDLKTKASDLLKKAKENKEKTITLNRNGKKAIKEADLWEEVFRLGVKCQAGEALKKKYPEVFDAYTEQDKKATELNNYFLTEFGFSFNNITPTLLLRFIQKIVEYENKKSV
jgi:hypothetical protein